MTWPKVRTTLASAQAIFVGAEIKEMLTNGEVTGYSAVYDEKILEDKALTSLCRRLWLLANAH